MRGVVGIECGRQVGVQQWGLFKSNSGHGHPAKHTPAPRGLQGSGSSGQREPQPRHSLGPSAVASHPLLQAEAGCSALPSRGRRQAAVPGRWRSWAIGPSLGPPPHPLGGSQVAPSLQAQPSYRDSKRVPPSALAKPVPERPAWLELLPGSLQAKGHDVQGPGLNRESSVSLSSLMLITNILFTLFLPYCKIAFSTSVCTSPWYMQRCSQSAALRRFPA